MDPVAKSTLDKDLKKLVGLESATHDIGRRLATPGLALVFLLVAMVWASVSLPEGPFNYLVIIAAVIAGYMALNVGANDVANNMGPAVGSKALTMVGALLIAAVCEAAGALLAGGDVVNTVARDLLTPAAELDSSSFILVMMAALLASALWINLATVLGAPVSTTHAVVGGVLGSGITSAGLAAVAWPMVGAIVASWVISPVMGGVIAALFLAFIRRTIADQPDKVAAVRVWLPIIVALMTGIFAMYMASKGLSRLWKPGWGVVLLVGAGFFVLGWLVAMPWVRKRSRHIENRNRQVATLFRLPLVISAALLSFAHGANDVANAVGPFAAIVAAVESGGTMTAGIELPLWVLAIGAVGIAVGLGLFGPKLIRMVGEKITKMNEVRAFCVALSAATTVLAASALGLPVSSTHIAVGAVFGVGFMRELISQWEIGAATVPVQGHKVDPARLNATPEAALKNDGKRERRRLVRRQHVFSIAAAWVITVPAAAVLSGLLYLGMQALIGPALAPGPAG
jgi:inorganic phosphate transporter, PiT family